MHCKFLVYHHFAGSRDKVTRVDRKKAQEFNMNLDDIVEENHLIDKDVREQLSNQPEVFIDSLRGDYKGELQ